MNSIRTEWVVAQHRGWLRPVAFAAAGLALATAAVAQPGARAVRLSDVDGQVQLSVGNQILAASAPANTPMFEGTRVTTAEDGRAEIQFEDGSVARVSPDSSLVLSVLRQQGNATETELTLESGLAYFELQGNPSAGRFAVRFSGNTVSASGFTIFRLDLDNPPGTLAVFSGNAHMEGANALALDLHGGESSKLDASNPENYALAESIEPDSWDAWNSDRDQQLTAQEAQRTQATANVPDPSNPAWSDLDANGNWYNVPGQGYVWSPYAAGAAGWSPYGCGNWVYTSYYGYAWASCEPWGYLPYSYGMWSYYDGFGWGWMPGGNWWWNSGGWNPNVTTTAFKYTTPRRPRGGPVLPGGGGKGHEYQVVTVNRFRDSGSANPVRPRGGPVTIAGTKVQPLRPMAPRAVYTHEPGVSVSYRGVQRPSAPGAAFVPGTAVGGARTGYAPVPSAGNRGVIMNPGAAGFRPIAPSSGFAGRTGGRVAYSGTLPTSGSSGVRPSGGPVGGNAAHFSGGNSGPHVSAGGGGGAVHFSGGGGAVSHAGGGGGGSSHK